MSPGEVAALLSQGQHEKALAAANEGVRSNPEDPGWRTVLGAVFVEMHRYVEGEEVLRGLPYPESLFNLAVALRGQARFDEQIASLARIPPEWPGAPRVAKELAQAGLRLLFAGRAESAAQAFHAQLAFQPGSRAAYYNLTLALLSIQRYEEALAAISQAVAAGHRDAEILGMLVNAKGLTCDWSGLEEIVAELRRAASEAGQRPVHPQTAQYLAQVPPGEQRQWAEKYSRATFGHLEPIERPSAASATGKLRVGYISSDFRDHAVAWLAVGLLENHDRERFHVSAYSTGPRVAVPVRERIARSIDQFVDCSGVPGRTVAERIAADGIDVLVDMGGHTQGARLDILAYRPAPVQGHFLGYAGTTGAPFVDFFVADDITVPAGAEGAFSERVLRMARCCLPGDPQRAVPQAATRDRLGLPRDAVVLCSFNQQVKVRPAVFMQWCELLHAAPNTILWMRDPGEGAKRRLLEIAAARGVEGRIVFASHVPTREEHLDRLAAADIALDTFPYGSHTNAADALWAGVPLVTTYGETFASRVGASMLSTAGLSEWAFADARTAFDAVLALAREPALLAAAKEKARGARSSPLFDAVSFARDFERVLVAAAGR